MPMQLSDYLTQILKNGDLDSKLIHIPNGVVYGVSQSQIINLPFRRKKISFSDKQLRFPRGNFHEREKAAMALHSFANHELLAIEIMAATLLKFPAKDELERRLHRGIVQALREEQFHFKLYNQRLNELGYEFGDFPLNQFFWQYFQKIESIQQYLCVMALTFEAANLDFASYYYNVFLEIEDIKTAKILNTVLLDEISHVALGVRYLNLWRKDQTLWQYYQHCLPYPLTASRSKGKVFYSAPRKQARMDQEFISSVENFNDNFRVTERKEWKQCKS